ncbi:MAG: 4-hydroxy-2-oxovalerate aldolase, partial [Saprospiraceae bacterium]|nr:4-hydroxy-2-oxovalerate aldolase [Saprospiraceae bacterium]
MRHPIYIQDVTLRDGMHAIGHQYSKEQVLEISQLLDNAGVDAIEVAHGDGLAGGSFNYGFGAHSDWSWLEGIRETLTHAKLTTLILPGIATINDLEKASALGVESVRIATHCTEADISPQHIEAAKKLNMDVGGFLMMAHMTDAESLAQQAKIMEEAGADCVYVTDSAGALLMSDVVERIEAFKAVLRPETEIGIHCHHNLSLGVANTIVAYEHGANRLDASLAGMGAGAGNAPLEVLIAVLNRMGVETSSDLFQLMDIADDVIRPLQKRPVRVD